MPRVFISYRRDDSAAHAGRIYDRLRDHFGAEQVFRDIDAITPGAKFAKVIAERIENCDALIAIIGTDWLRAEDGEGTRRLDDPDDWVKAEIREALTRDKLVIPVLVEGARMPKDSELPAAIAALAGCHAIEISESRFDDDAKRLLGALNGSPAPATFAQSALRKRNWRWIALMCFGAVVPSALAVVPSSSASLHDWWGWIAAPDVQRTLTFLGGGLVALALAAWAIYKHCSKKNGNNGSHNTFNIGITLEQYEAGLKRREQEVRAELLRTNRADSASVNLLEKELAAVEAKRQNSEQSLGEYKSKFAEANQALEKLRGDVPTDQLAQAQQALQKGDAAAAEKLFGDVVQSGKRQAAEAAFQLGALANNRIDYAKAYEHYSDAARLQPENPAYLNMAGRLAYETARYVEAQLLLEKALAIHEKSLGPEHPDVAQSLNNLAALYNSQGQYAQAEPLYQRALNILQKSLPADHPNLATGMENYATLLENLGRKEEAQRWLAKAVAARQLHAQKNSKAR